MQVKTNIKNAYDLIGYMNEREFYKYVIDNTIPEPDEPYLELYQRIHKAALNLTREHNIKGRQYFMILKDPDVIIYPVIRKTKFMMKDGKKFIALHNTLMNHFKDSQIFIPKGWLIITSTLCSKTGRFLLENDFMISSLLDLKLAEDAEI